MKSHAQIQPAAFCRRLRDALAQQPQSENTAVALAKKSDVSVRQILDYLNEKPDVNPRAATIAVLANALGVTFNWLAYGEGAMTDKPSRPFIVGNDSSMNAHPFPKKAPAANGRHPVLIEPPATRESARELPPLHVVIAHLARHLDIEEAEVTDFVLSKMKARKP